MTVTQWVYFTADGPMVVSEPEPELPKAKPEPEVPPPVWDERPISGERCMQATRAMCS